MKKPNESRLGNSGYGRLYILSELKPHVLNESSDCFGSEAGLELSPLSAKSSRSLSNFYKSARIR